MAQNLFGTLTSPSLPLLDANFTELYQLYNAMGVSGGVPRATAGMLFGSNDVYLYAGGTDKLSIRVGPSSNYTFIEMKSMGGGYPMIDGPGGLLAFGAAGAAKLVVDATALRPATDNAISAGTASYRYSVVYAGTGTINTSDAREKTDVEPLSAAEIRASARLARAVGSFRFLASVAEKGAAARRHIGLTVQQAIAILEDEGLQPMRYAFICHDEWEEVDRYGFRTDELLLFIARGLEARLTALEDAAA